MNLTIQITKEDLLNAYRLAARKPWWLRLPDYIFYLIILFTFFFPLVLYLAGYSHFSYSTLVLGFFILLYLIYRFVIYPRRVDKIYRSSLDLQESTEVIFSEERLEIISKNSQVRRDWDKVFAWKENKEYLLLYLSESSFSILPISDLEKSSTYAFVKGKLIDMEISHKKIPTGAILFTIVEIICGGLILSAYFT